MQVIKLICTVVVKDTEDTDNIIEKFENEISCIPFISLYNCSSLVQIENKMIDYPDPIDNKTQSEWTKKSIEVIDSEMNDIKARIVMKDLESQCSS